MAKNPKRVAAGKKAWRNRSKTKSRRSSGGGRSRRKPIQRGITGRVGAFIAGVAPVAIVGAASIEDAHAHYKVAGNIISTAKIGLLDFVNGFSQGFFGKKAFEKTDFYDKDGRKGSRGMPDIVPAGSLWLVTGSGLAMMLVDAIASKLAGGRPVKVPLTNYNAIGGS